MKRLVLNLIASIGMTLQPFFELLTDYENILTIVRIVSVFSLIAFLSLQIYWFRIDKKKKQIKREKKSLVKDYRRFKSEIGYSKPSFLHYIKIYFKDEEILKLIHLKELNFIELDSKSTYESGGIERYEFNRDNK
jgi:hypothetical protein